MGLKPDGGTGDDISSSSILARMSSIKLFSVVDVVVVGLNPGGKNLEMSSCWIVDKTLSPPGGPLGLNPLGNNDEGNASSTGILAKILIVKLLFESYFSCSIKFPWYSIELQF